MLYAKLAAGIAALAVGFAGGWRTHSWKTAADERDRVAFERAAEVAQRFKVEAASTTYETTRAARTAQARVITKEVIRVVEAPAYAAACLDDSGLQLLADQIATRGVVREPVAAVPSAAAP